MSVYRDKFALLLTAVFVYGFFLDAYTDYCCCVQLVEVEEVKCCSSQQENPVQQAPSENSPKSCHKAPALAIISTLASNHNCQQNCFDINQQPSKAIFVQHNEISAELSFSVATSQLLLPDALTRFPARQPLPSFSKNPLFLINSAFLI